MTTRFISRWSACTQLGASPIEETKTDETDGSRGLVMCVVMRRLREAVLERGLLRITIGEERRDLKV